MTLERQFRWVTDKLKVWDVPLGKAVLLLLFMGLPGKFIPYAIRWILAKTLSPTAPDYFKKVDIYTQVLGFVTALGGAAATKKWLRGFLGETGAEAMALGWITGSIDSGWNRVGVFERDLSDVIGHGARDKLLDIIGKIKGTALSGPAQVTTAAGRKTALAGFPEAGSSGWREQLPWLAGPKTQRPAQTASPRPAPVASPQEPADPIQRMEEILRAKSRM